MGLETNVARCLLFWTKVREPTSLMTFLRHYQIDGSTNKGYKQATSFVHGATTLSIIAVRISNTQHMYQLSLYWVSHILLCLVPIWLMFVKLRIAMLIVVRLSITVLSIVMFIVVIQSVALLFVIKLSVFMLCVITMSIAMLSISMVSAIKLSVLSITMMSVILQSISMLSVILPIITMLSVILQSINILSVISQSANMLSVVAPWVLFFQRNERTSFYPG
jgi:hypothetical protein